MNHDELLDIVNKHGDIIGSAPRSVVHGNPSLIHRVVHVLVFNRGGDLLLQKRSYTKDVAPGRWDTSVGGHVGLGEELVISSKREMEEELGIVGCEPEYLYSYMHSNPYETELVISYRCIYEGQINFNQGEIDEVRYWSFGNIRDAVGKKILSDNFEHEFHTYLNFSDSQFSSELFI